MSSDSANLVRSIFSAVVVGNFRVEFGVRSNYAIKPSAGQALRRN